MKKHKGMVLDREMFRRELVGQKQIAYARCIRLRKSSLGWSFIDDNGDFVILDGSDKVEEKIRAADLEFERASIRLMEFDRMSDSMTDEEVWDRWGT